MAGLLIDGVDHSRHIAVAKEGLGIILKHLVVQIFQYLIGQISAREIKNRFNPIVTVKIHQRSGLFLGRSTEKT